MFGVNIRITAGWQLPHDLGGDRVTTIEAKPKPNLYVRGLRSETALFKWTWVKTQKLCKPEREDYSDRRGASKGYKLLSKSYVVRSGVGYLIWVGLNVLGYLAPGQKNTTLGQTLYVLAPYWMILPCIMAVSLALYVITKPTKKRITRLSLTVPITRVLILAPSAGIWIFAIWLSSSPGANTIWGLDNWAPHPSPLINFLGWLSSIVGLVILPLWLPLCIWLAFVPMNFTVQLFRYNFRAIDGHPYLWPITVITSVWATVVFDAVVSGPSRAFSPNAHFWLRLITSWGGPVILSAIAVAEMSWLWHYRIRPRDGSVGPPAKGPTPIELARLTGV
jgi:hypothetical protein